MLRKYLRYFLLSFSLFFAYSLTAQAGALTRHANDTIGGNPNGKVSVVEFFDYQCSHCVNMASTIANIIQANPNVRFVFKDYPIRGEMSELAALAAIAASKQGKYYRFSHALLTTNLPLSEGNIFEIAKSVGLNTATLKKDMSSSSVKSQLRSNFAMAGQLNVNGTPAFFIGRTNANDNGESVLGEMSQRELQEAIDKASR